jgi:hypothetical protein
MSDLSTSFVDTDYILKDTSSNSKCTEEGVCSEIEEEPKKLDIKSDIPESIPHLDKLMSQLFTSIGGIPSSTEEKSKSGKENKLKHDYSDVDSDEDSDKEVYSDVESDEDVESNEDVESDEDVDFSKDNVNVDIRWDVIKKLTDSHCDLIRAISDMTRNS